jgi:hypothetical protein
MAIFRGKPITDSVVAVFVTQSATENCVEEFQKSGFGVEGLSIIGRDFHATESVAGCYTAEGRLKYWGKMANFWDGLWQVLDGGAFLSIPGVGSVVVAGPFVAWIVDALEGAIVVRGLYALGAGLISFGIAKENAATYENCIESGKFLLIVHGTQDEIRRAHILLRSANAESVATHAVSPEPAHVM